MTTPGGGLEIGGVEWPAHWNQQDIINHLRSQIDKGHRAIRQLERVRHNVMNNAYVNLTRQKMLELERTARNAEIWIQRWQNTLNGLKDTLRMVSQGPYAGAGRGAITAVGGGAGAAAGGYGGTAAGGSSVGTITRMPSLPTPRFLSQIARMFEGVSRKSSSAGSITM